MANVNFLQGCRFVRVPYWIGHLGATNSDTNFKLIP